MKKESKSLNIGDKMRCVEQYVDGGNHKFLVGEIFTITSMTMGFCQTDVPRYKGGGMVLIQWYYIEDYFMPLKQYRNEIINELL